MSETPAELRYAASHEWAQLEDGVVTVGISDFAQDALGDVVYVELPELDQEVAAGAEIAVVESVKAASDIYAPVSGTVVAINDALEDAPERVNQDPYGDGWFFKLETDRHWRTRQPAGSRRLPGPLRVGRSRARLASVHPAKQVKSSRAIHPTYGRRHEDDARAYRRGFDR